MKLIESKVEYIPQEDGLEGIYKQIELAGRTAYHSQDKITPDSAKNFVEKMIKSKHGAALEAGTVYLAIPITTNHAGFSENHYRDNSYSRFNESLGLSMKDEYGDKCDCWCITTNYRVLVENNWLDDLKYLCSPTEYHEKRYTMRFTCSRAIANELVRHRVFSFLQESTRYINYSKERHGGEITFIKPSWFKNNQLPLDLKVAQSSNTNGAVFYERPYKAYWVNTDAKGFDWYKEDFFIHSCQTAEQCYFLMLEEGAAPQQARDILPLATKSEIIMTGFESDWKYFLDLRLREITGKVHPDMKILAEQINEKLTEKRITS